MNESFYLFLMISTNDSDETQLERFMDVENPWVSEVLNQVAERCLQCIQRSFEWS